MKFSLFRSILLCFMFLLHISTPSIVGVIYAKDRTSYESAEPGNSSSKKKDRILSDKYTGKQLEKVKKSLRHGDDYRLLVQSTGSIDKVVLDFSKGTPKPAKVKKVGENLYMVYLSSERSDFVTEFGKIDSGIIPDQVSGYNIVEPEVFQVSASPEYLTGESIDQLWWMDRLRVPSGISDTSPSEKIKVAILDTGIDTTHPDLMSNYNSVLSYDFISGASGGIDDNGHGTQVAGVLGAAINGGGIFGVNPDTDIISLKVLDASGLGTSYDVLEALSYVGEQRIPIINMSFGGLVGDPTMSPICQAITNLKSSGTITVVAAGNMGQEVNNTLPAACTDAITVGSSSHDGTRAIFSNHGALVDVYAPGVDIYTSTLDGGYITKDGTSFSAPIVAGLIATELEQNPDMSYADILSSIQSYSGLTLANPGVDTSSGVTTASGETLSGSTFSGVLESISPPIDYSGYSYYSGIFQQNGIIYGNSLYPDTIDFSRADLSQVQVYTYDEYQTLFQGLSGSFQAMSVPTSGLVGEWKLDGNANDTSGNGNNGTPTNMSYQQDSILGMVGAFSGSSNIRLPNTTSLEVGNGFTVAAWVRFSESQNIETYIAARYNASNNAWFLGKRLLVNGDIGFQVRAGGVNATAAVSQAYNDNQWHFIVGTKSGTTLNLYIDNVLKTTSTVSGLGSTSGAAYPYIGSHVSGGGFWNGNIGDVRIYNRALSASEIQDLYNDGMSTMDNNTPTNLPDITYSALYNNPLLSYSNLEQSSRVYKTNEQLSKNSATQQTKKNTVGDPVHLATGEFTYENTLMSVPGSRIPYTLDVYYTNQNYYNGPLGINWDHNYNLVLSEESNGNVLFYNGRLGVYRFIKNGANYDYNIGLGATLSYAGGLYTLTYDSGKVYQFNSEKKISKISDTFGDVFDFAYSGGLLSQVTDSLGRDYIYTYTPENRLDQVTDPYGRKVEFSYYDGTAASGSIYDLQNIIINNATGSTRTIGFTYSTGGDDRSNHNIVDLIDAKGQIYVHNTYEDDRVKTQTYGTGTITYNYTLSGSSVIENNIIDRLGNQTIYVYDVYGNNTELRQYTATGTQSYVYTYNTGGQLMSERRPRGNGYIYTYDTTGHVIEKRMKADITQPNGTSDLVTTVSYDSYGNVTQIVEPIGKTTNLTYTGVSLLARSEIILGTGTVVQTYTYDSLGRLVDKRDALGNPTLYVYVGSNTLPYQVKMGTGAEQIVTSYSYDNSGNPLTVTDGSGSVTSYGYDVFSRLVSETSPEGVVKTYTYDANNNKTASSVALGGGLSVSTSTIYDALDLPVSVTQEVSEGVYATITYGYNANGDIIETLYPNGLKETRTYNTLGKLATVTQSGSVVSTTSYGYDANGNLISEIKNSDTTIYTYDLYDRLIRTTDALGGYRTFAYDKADNILTNQFYTSTGLLMQEIGYTYDVLSRLTKMSEKKLENSTYRDTVYTYDKNGNKLTEKNALNYTTIYTHDSLGRQRTKTLPNGLQYENIYDKNSNIIQEKDISLSGTISVTHTYDRDNRRLSSADNLGNTTHYEYNPLGQITRLTDPRSIDTIYTYDYRGKVLTETRAGKTIIYTYDLMGNRTGLTDALNNITAYTYHPEGLLATETQNYTGGVQRTTSYLYDADSNLWKKTDANGTVITHTYDALNRLTRKDIIYGSQSSYPGTVRFTTYTYDALSRLLTATSESGFNNIFTYDSLDNLTRDQVSNNAVSGLNLQHDILGRVTRMPYTQTIGYANIFYDNIDRITKVTNNANISYIDWTYSHRSLIREQRKNTLGTNYTYDSIGRLSTVSGSGYVSPLTYSYDSNSNIISKGANTYTYNTRDELTHAVYTPGMYSNMSGSSYTYDLMGSRQSESNISNITLSGETLTPLWNYQTGSQNTYTSITAGSGLTYAGVSLSGTILYDSNGNIRGNQIGSQQQYLFYYDYDNRLTRIDRYTTPTARVQVMNYAYDGLGRRAYALAYNSAGTAHRDRTFYTYYQNNLIEERIEGYSGTSFAGNIIYKSYIYGGGLSGMDSYNSPSGGDDVAMILQKYVKKTGNTSIANVTLYYTERDHLGSIDKIYNESGATIEEYTYTPYGGTYIKNQYTNTGAYVGQYIPIKLYTDTLAPTVQNSSTGTLYKNNRLFTGREYDTDTGLYYMRARHYDPNSGRFLQEDPIGTKDDINLYRYVKNNPLNFTDRFGMEGKPFTVRVWNSYMNGSDRLGESLFNLGNVITQDDVVNDLERIRTYGGYTSLASIPFFFFPPTVPIGVGIAFGAGGTSLVAGGMQSYITESYSPVVIEGVGAISGPIGGKVLKNVGVLSKVEFNTDAMRYMGHYADNAYGFVSTQASRIGYAISESVEQVIGFVAGKILPN